jgi:glycosyltransferase involved in cell wall biosynthesis
VALAPYATSVASFTRFADPSKLKLYAAAGLPIVLTDVPPNAADLERDAGARVVADEAGAVADGIAEALATPAAWQHRRAAALAYAERFTWPRIVDGLLPALGLLE